MCLSFGELLFRRSCGQSAVLKRAFTAAHGLFKKYLATKIVRKRSFAVVAVTSDMHRKVAPEARCFESLIYVDI